MLCIFCLHRANWHPSATLNEVFPFFFLICKANAWYNSQRRDRARTITRLIVLYCVLFLCKCVLYYCHRVSTQLQLTNISVSIYLCHAFHIPTTPPAKQIAFQRSYYAEHSRVEISILITKIKPTQLYNNSNTLCKSDQFHTNKKVQRDHTVKFKKFHILYEWQQIYKKKDTHMYIHKTHTHRKYKYCNYMQ